MDFSELKVQNAAIKSIFRTKRSRIVQLSQAIEKWKYNSALVRRHSWDAAQETQGRGLQLSQRVKELESQSTTLSNEKNDLERRVKRLEYENNKLSNEKRWAVDVYSRKISTLEYRVWELDHQNTKLSIAEKKIKDKVEELRVLGVQKAEMDAWIASLESRLEAALVKNQELESTSVKALIENDMLWSVIERLMMGRLVEVKEAAAKASDSEKVEIMKELEDHNIKVEEIQTNKNMTKGENDKIQSKVLREMQKHSLFEARVERLKMELDALVKA
uniref:Uncharacterized protein n=1 Tax=Oryza meridionalis TaxID=40149 RepID=A0A0E0DAK9_9ORYZ